MARFQHIKKKIKWRSIKIVIKSRNYCNADCFWDLVANFICYRQPIEIYCRLDFYNTEAFFVNNKNGRLIVENQQKN